MNELIAKDFKIITIHRFAATYA